MRVELHGAGKHFGRIPALVDVDLALPSGSRTALVGPNGSGKSTLVRLLMGMLHGEGSIALDGLDPTRHRPELAHRIAYVPQVAPRLWASVDDLVRATSGLRGIARARVAEVADELELDLHAIGRRPFRALSGGMRQKLLAAIALCADADLLILDEPTASMDPESRSTFYRLLDELPRRPTVLLCSHRLDEIRRQVDRVVELAEGRIAWQGASTEWLVDHAEAVVELRTAGEDAAAWLVQNGFCRGRTGWWQRAVPAADRAAVVGVLVQTLGSRVVDVMARDLERGELRPVELEELR